MREALRNGGEVPEAVSSLVDAVRELEKLDQPENFPKTLDALKQLTEKNVTASKNDYIDNLFSEIFKAD
jgi:CRISPR-associated protein Cmr2